jgi:flagellar export protein FliJ
MKARECWPVLAKKAQDEVDAAMAVVVQIRQNIEHLQSRRQQLLDMYADYKRRIEDKQQQWHSMADTANHRQFMSHLLQLVDRIDQDLQRAHNDLTQAREAQQKADQQRIKMASLMEQDLHRVKVYQQKKEQKHMDALGITLFNLKA